MGGTAVVVATAATARSIRGVLGADIDLVPLPSVAEDICATLCSAPIISGDARSCRSALLSVSTNIQSMAAMEFEPTPFIV